MITPRERLKIYKNLREYYVNDSSWVFESQADIEFDGKYSGKRYHGFCGQTRRFNCNMEDLPELKAQKPKTGWKLRKAFWWSPFETKTRIRALDRAIEKVEKIANI